MHDTATMQDTTRQQIRAFVETATRDASMSDDHNFFESGLVNSLFAAELVAFVEQTFGITVDNEDLDLANFCSVDALTGFVARKAGRA